MSKAKIYLPLLILGTAFWGISFPISKEAFETIHPYTFLFYRFLIAAIALALVFHKQILCINKSTVIKGAIAGIFLFMGIGWQAVGLKYTTSSNAAFIAGIEVVLIPVFAFLFMKKAIQPKIWVACCFALAGLYIIAMASGLSDFKIGDLLVFIGSLFYSAYVLYVGKISTQKSDDEKKLDPRNLVIIQLAVCAIASAILTVTTQGGIEGLRIPVTTNTIQTLLFVGILSTGYMYCIQNIAQKYIAPEKIALTYLCEPIFATLFAYLLLGEDITKATILGGSLILLAMLTSEIDPSRYIKILKRFPIKIRH